MITIPNKDFFNSFQEKLNTKYSFSLDKLHSTTNFWCYNPLHQEKNYYETQHHFYHLFYDTMFHEFKNVVKNVLEIGVFKGYSMLMWKEYFKNANIYGIDIDFSPKNLGLNALELCKNESNIFLKKLNAYDSSQTNSYFDKLNIEFDIIIEDGSHHPVHQLYALNYYKKYLKKGGYFVVEDCLYNEENYNTNFLKRLDSTMNIYKEYKYLFPDVVKRKKIKLADCGTLFKDEILDLSEFEIKEFPPYEYELKFRDVDLDSNNYIKKFISTESIIFFKKKL